MSHLFHRVAAHPVLGGVCLVFLVSALILVAGVFRLRSRGARFF